MNYKLFIIFLVILLMGCSLSDNSEAVAIDVIWAIQPEYDDVYGFTTNISAVYQNDNLLFINKSQNNIFNKIFIQDLKHSYSDKLFMNKLPSIRESYESSFLHLSRAGNFIDPLCMSSNITGTGPIFYIAKSNNKHYGIVNKLGQWIYQPEFDMIRILNGTPIVMKDGICGFIKDNGECLYLPGVGRIEEFVQGIAMVYVNNGKLLAEYNFIDCDGNILFENNFSKVPPKYHDGIVCYNENNLYGYKKLNGEILITPQFKEAEIFSEGLAAVTNHNNKIGYINKQGKIIIPYINGFYGGSFKNGMATFSIKSISGAIKDGIIDKSGKWIINPIYDNCFYREKYNIWELQRNWNVSDIFFVNTNKIIKRLELAEVITYSSIVGWKGKYNYLINVNKDKMDWYKFDYIDKFEEGLAPARQNGKYGYIDISGQWIYSPQFEDARNFSEGLAAVKLNGKWGYIANPLIYNKWIPNEWERGASLGLYTIHKGEQNANPNDLLTPISTVLERLLHKQYGTI